MIIIDGTNLLCAVQESPDGREIRTEVQLCETLDRYFALTGEEGEVVFDGAGPADKGVFGRVTYLEIFFSGFNKDADTVIEEKLLVATAPQHLTVVSSDRRLRLAAAGRKAAALKSELFWSLVLRELASKRSRRQEPEEKRDGLTDSETDKWLDVFGL
ncbi:MAG: NYN domain-containing protein [Sedimentisphaerales bacterium]|nr:NYN domain-containing protein [Sedimentisphaerales bacterium]